MKKIMCVSLIHAAGMTEGNATRKLAACFFPNNMV